MICFCAQAVVNHTEGTNEAKTNEIDLNVVGNQKIPDAIHPESEQRNINQKVL